MNPTQKLHDLGQSIWLDFITRDLLSSGTLDDYMREFSVTGLTSNPTIFYNAINSSHSYDDSIAAKYAESKSGKTGESLILDIMLEDITRAADLLRPVFDSTNGMDGWVSLEVSPLLAHDTAGSVASAKDLHARAARPNVFIKIPGTAEGFDAIEEAAFAGVPINVTLLFSREHYVAAAQAWLGGIERRIDAGLNANVPSVASVFVSRWDTAVAAHVPPELKNKLGIAVAKSAYQAYQELLLSPRWQRAYNFGAQPQRLLWGSTGTKDPSASDTLYVSELAAPFTINTIPEKTLKAFADHGQIAKVLSPDGGDFRDTLERFADAGIDVDALAAQLQDEGVNSFFESWNKLATLLKSKMPEYAV
ncbi:MAG: transaldolase [Planctomycetaceae bacterium]|nr:transaldolase [Planctomycetaceae bacterium]